MPRNREQRHFQSFYTEAIHWQHAMPPIATASSSFEGSLELQDNISSHGVELARAITGHNRTQHF
jgi:hypothetical protein